MNTQDNRARRFQSRTCRHPILQIGMTLLLMGTFGDSAFATSILPEVQLDQRITNGGSIDIEYHGLFADSPTNAVLSYPNSFSSTSTAVAAISPAPNVSVQVQVTPDSPTVISSFLTYYGEVVGPDRGQVPIDLIGSVSADMSGTFSNQIVIGIAGYAPLRSSALCDGDPFFSVSFVNGTINKTCDFTL